MDHQATISHQAIMKRKVPSTAFDVERYLGLHPIFRVVICSKTNAQR